MVSWKIFPCSRIHFRAWEVLPFGLATRILHMNGLGQDENGSISQLLSCSIEISERIENNKGESIFRNTGKATANRSAQRPLSGSKDFSVLPFHYFVVFLGILQVMKSTESFHILKPFAVSCIGLLLGIYISLVESRAVSPGSFLPENCRACNAQAVSKIRPIGTAEVLTISDHNFAAFEKKMLSRNKAPGVSDFKKHLVCYSFRTCHPHYQTSPRRMCHPPSMDVAPLTCHPLLDVTSLRPNVYLIFKFWLHAHPFFPEIWVCTKFPAYFRLHQVANNPILQFVAPSKCNT